MFPRLRWWAFVWLLVSIPAYTCAYGWWHFLFLCNLGILITAIALMAGSPILLASQLVASPVIALLWIVDAGWRVATGDFLHGGTAYMWDEHLPILVRVLSLYHVWWPVLLWVVVRKIGYDRRAILVQSAIAIVVWVVALTVAPSEENLNYVHYWRSPDHARSLTQAWGMLAFLLVVVYVPTHVLLCWLMPKRVAEHGRYGKVLP